MQQKAFYNSTKFFKIALISLIVARLILNALIPVMDQTEARYAEIARLMAETGNWITPQIDYSIPFWAKPPLSTWLSALSIKVFGVNEFAVRFPAFAISMLLLLLLKPFARRANLPLVIPAFILFTLPEFLLHVGVVSTDMTLLLSITLMMVSFWETMNDGKRYWSYLFFVAIGLGFLAKGPIILLLTGPPLFAWTAWFKSFRKLFTAFPWIVGILIVIAVALPWYYLAEKATPGFLEYFFVGEHYKRFFDASWKGDKYGFPKIQPFGIIWVFLFSLALPWILFFANKVATKPKIILKDRWLLFLALWILWTPLFFTSSKSLIHTYILPCCVPLALFVATFWDQIKHKKTYVVSALVVPVLSVMIIMLYFVSGVFENNTNTDKYILKDYNGEKLFYLGEKTYSSQFYSRGHVKTIAVEKLDSLKKADRNFLLLVRKRNMEAVQDAPDLIKLDESRKSVLFKIK
ncbi:glycosyltransferase family 39 protein [Chryseobacterium sp. H3056]|uniref:Glycosyltransferase family 39 protein n=1 Tax=Kaistella daneshvariae TaxID=2487074 RepID=A0A3N0WRL3_9FLAO|nr:glycosyltransferase family 39 protein [Kaistella daneshvariae]ROI07748.1 glycosyltransferase family 39 protein [Kaistella daneshvariae]